MYQAGVVEDAHQHGYEGEAAILDLLDLKLSKHLRVVSQTQGVKGATCKCQSLHQVMAKTIQQSKCYTARVIADVSAVSSEHKSHCGGIPLL